MSCLTNPVWRHDRHGKKTLVTSDQTKRALARLQASIDRADARALADLKIRQDAGTLSIGERMLKSIFGEIK